MQQNMTCVVSELLPFRGKNSFQPGPSNDILVFFRVLLKISDKQSIILIWESCAGSLTQFL